MKYCVRSHPRKANVKVLHTVDTFLHLSENWIYPQIVSTPETTSRVLYRAILNLTEFPLAVDRLISQISDWNLGFGLPRLFDGICRRLGWSDAYAKSRICAWGPDVLHAHFGMRGWETLALKRSLKVPLITTFYGGDAWFEPTQHPFWKGRYKTLFEEGELFLVEGPAMQRRLEYLGCSGEKVHIQRIGVDLDRLQFRPPDFTGGLKVIMMGRFVEKKGLADGVRACAEARRRGVNLALTIIGDATAGDPASAAIKAEILELTNKSGLADVVRFTGFVSRDEASEICRQHNVFLCPSRHASDGDAEGGSPVALTEAMALGLVCIGTRHCDIPEVIIDDVTGWLSPEDDVSMLAGALERLNNEADRGMALARAGRQHVERNFSASDQLAQLSRLYRSFVS